MKRLFLFLPLIVLGVILLTAQQQNFPNGSGGSGTVTNTGGALTSNALVLGAGTNDTKVIAGLTSDGTAGLNLGATGVGGTLTIFGSASGSNTLTAPGNGTQLTSSANTVTIGSASTIRSNAGTFTVATTAGDLSLTPTAGNTVVKFATSGGNFGFGTGKGQHLVTQAANNDLAGVCTAAAAATCTVNFTTAYSATPVCTATDVTGNTTVSKVTPATGSLIITTAASSSDAIDYICIGSPN